MKFIHSGGTQMYQQQQQQQQLHSHNQHLPSSGPGLPPEKQFLLQGGDAGLILSTDAKPRLKWTPELHERFVEAVHQLGGPDSEYTIETHIMRIRNTMMEDLPSKTCKRNSCRSNAENDHEAHGDPWTHPVPSEEPSPGSTRTHVELVVNYFCIA
jgi:SHAQKYF class myb-like DNA-binding protein